MARPRTKVRRNAQCRKEAAEARDQAEVARGLAEAARAPGAVVAEVEVPQTDRAPPATRPAVDVAIIPLGRAYGAHASADFVAATRSCRCASLTSFRSPGKPFMAHHRGVGSRLCPTNAAQALAPGSVAQQGRNAKRRFDATPSWDKRRAGSRSDAHGNPALENSDWSRVVPTVPMSPQRPQRSTLGAVADSGAG